MMSSKTQTSAGVQQFYFNPSTGTYIPIASAQTAGIMFLIQAFCQCMRGFISLSSKIVSIGFTKLKSMRAEGRTTVKMCGGRLKLILPVLNLNIMILQTIFAQFTAVF